MFSVLTGYYWGVIWLPIFFYALVTQLVEYQTFNLRVAGSNPAGRTSTHTAIFTRNRLLIYKANKRVEFFGEYPSGDGGLAQLVRATVL